MSDTIIVAIVPLAQTALWVLLVGVIFWRYRKSVDKLIEIFQGRMEGGSSLKAGPLEIGERIQPQDSESQKEEVQREAEEYVEEQSAGREPTMAQRTDIRESIVIAEDLVLRAIQDTYGETLKRNVRITGPYTVDAIFTKAGRLYIVEVKSVSRHSTLRVVRTGMRQLESVVKNEGFKEARGVLALAYIEGPPKQLESNDINELVSDSSGRIQVMAWTLKELKQRYGITD